MEQQSESQHCEDESKVKEQMKNLQNLIDKDFERAITQLVNEIDLVFDYIPTETKSKLQDYSKKICTDNEFKRNEMKIIFDKLKPFENEIYKISILNKKTKKSDLDFLDTLVLFEDTLSTKVFSHENKNTKKTIVNYLSSMYMAASFASMNKTDGEFNIEELSKELGDFVESIKQKAELSTLQHENSKQKSGCSGNGNGNGSGSSGSGGIGSLMSTLMGNPEIMNMAADLTQDLQKQQVDPLSLISSLVSGKPNGQLDNIVSRISNKIEEKISSGELDKNDLEQQAKEIMNSQAPMFQQLMKSFGNKNNIKTKKNKKK